MLLPTTLTFCVLALALGDRPLRTISETAPSAASYFVQWVFFAVVSLLPLLAAIILLLVAPR